MYDIKKEQKKEEKEEKNKERVKERRLHLITDYTTAYVHKRPTDMLIYTSKMMKPQKVSKQNIFMTTIKTTLCERNLFLFSLQYVNQCTAKATAESEADSKTGSHQRTSSFLFFFSNQSL